MAKKDKTKSKVREFLNKKVFNEYEVSNIIEVDIVLQEREVKSISAVQIYIK